VPRRYSVWTNPDRGEARYVQSLLQREQQRRALFNLRDEWESFLRKEDEKRQYRLFASLTFRGEIGAIRSEKLARCWANELNRRAFGRQYLKREERLAIAFLIERQLLGRRHLHGLLSGPPRLTGAIAERAWRTRGGGFAEVHEIRSWDAAVLYLRKKIDPESQVEITLLP